MWSGGKPLSVCFLAYPQASPMRSRCSVPFSWVQPPQGSQMLKVDAPIPPQRQDVTVMSRKPGSSPSGQTQQRPLLSVAQSNKLLCLVSRGQE